MTKPPLLVVAEWILWAAAACILGVGVLAVTRDHAVPQPTLLALPGGGPPLALPHDSMLIAAARSVASHNPFRFDRTAPERRPPEDPASAEAVALPPDEAGPVPPILAGIVGPPYRAVLLRPGVAGAALLAEGTEIGGYRIVRIDRHGVLLNGPDSTVNLTVRRPW